MTTHPSAKATTDRSVTNAPWLTRKRMLPYDLTSPSLSTKRRRVTTTATAVASLQQPPALDTTDEEHTHDAPAKYESFATTSVAYRVPRFNHCRFLSQPIPTRTQALEQLLPWEWLVVQERLQITVMDTIASIWQHAQKSAEWGQRRKGRATGTSTAPNVGVDEHTPVLTAAFKAVYEIFQKKPQTEWGTDCESYAAQAYTNDLYVRVVAEFRRQRRHGLVRSGGTFVFRNQHIPVADVNVDPVVEVRHWGLVLDPWNTWRGVSFDGVVFINGVACGILEIKCCAPRNGQWVRVEHGKAYASVRELFQQLYLYVFQKPYYYPQVQTNLDVARRYWPTIFWADFCVWTPFHFTVETQTYDCDWHRTWCEPREIRAYFRARLPIFTERILRLARDMRERETSTKELETTTLTKDEVLRALDTHYPVPAAAAVPGTVPVGRPAAAGGAAAAATRDSTTATSALHARPYSSETLYRLHLEELHKSSS